MINAISLSEMSRLVGVAGYRIAYAIMNKALPAPQMVAGRRLWMPEDVPVVKGYFDRIASQTTRGRPPGPDAKTQPGGQ